MTWFLVGVLRVILIAFWCVFATLECLFDFGKCLVEQAFDRLEKEEGYNPL